MGKEQRKRNFMRNGIICLALSAMLLVLCAPAEAQQAEMYRIGFLRGAPPLEGHLELFRQTLKELGYIEGKNLTLEYRWAEGKADQLPRLAAQLVGLGLDVVVADGSRPTEALKAANRTIPIVMQSGNVIELGFVSSLARPGGNITGLSRTRYTVRCTQANGATGSEEPTTRDRSIGELGG
jgi:putative ABC transport system substrate-binding protein